MEVMNDRKNDAGSDVEKEKNVYEIEHIEDASKPEGKLHRQLKNRHVAMISIGGVIGTGLFLGTAGSLQNGGPIGLLLGYIVSALCWLTILSCTEDVFFIGSGRMCSFRWVTPRLSI